MDRCLSFRYPKRTRVRALELRHEAGDDYSVVTIISDLKDEGFGDVARNTVERWIREDPSRRAEETTELSQRLRHEIEAAAGDEKDQAERISASAARLADLLFVTTKRAQKELPGIEVRSVEDFCRITASLNAITRTNLEVVRALSALRGHKKKKTESASDGE